MIKKILKNIFIALITISIVFLVIDNIIIYKILKEYPTEEVGKFEIVDSVKIYYEEYGTGKPLLLIHGFMGATYEYAKVIDELSKRYKLIVVDLIGFGRSDKDKDLDYSRKNMGYLMNKLMNQIGIEIYSVIGHSMGGEVAANIAYYYPNIVDKMILVDSAGYNGIYIPDLPEILIKNVVQSYLWQKMFYNNSLYKQNSYDDSIFNKLYSMNRKIPPGTLKKLNNTDDSGKIKDNIRKINVPTLIIWGKEDKIIDVKYAYKFNKDIKGSKLVIIDNCGHIPNIEYKEIFISEVSNFLDNN